MTQTSTQPERVERLLTLRQLSHEWGCCVRTITRKIEKNEIEVVRLGDNMLRVRESEAAKHVAQRVVRRLASGGGRR